MADNPDDKSPFVVPKLCIKRFPVQHVASKKQNPELNSENDAESPNTSGGIKLVLRVPKDSDASTSSTLGNEENSEDGQFLEKDSEASKDSQPVEKDSVKLSSFISPATSSVQELDMSGNDDAAASPATGNDDLDDSATSPKRRRRKKRFRLTTIPQKTRTKMYKADQQESDPLDQPVPKQKRTEHQKKDGQKKEDLFDEKSTHLESTPSTDTIGPEPIRFPSPQPQSMANFSPIQLLFDHLLRGFLKKDPEYYFAYPVTEDIAPNYSSIISKPMDFLTIRKKIDANEYKDLNEFKADIALISSNAMLYNQKNTIYYLAAKKLQNVAEYMFSKEKMNAARKLIPQLSKLKPEELGYTAAEAADAAREKNKVRLGYYACIVDDMCPEEIIEQVRSAAADAKEKLNRAHPRIEVLFGDDAQSDQSKPTTLKMLMPEHLYSQDESSGDESEKKPKKVVLGDLVPKLKEGNPGLPRPDFSKDNVVPVTYLDNGPFSSFAPHYDSTWATLNKEESDLLLATFGGDEPCVRYIDSIRTFVQDTNEHLSGMVEHLVDEMINDPVAPIAEVVDTQANGYLNEISDGNASDAGSTNVQHMLDTNAALLKDLQTLQYQRLSTQPSFVLTQAPGPSESEMEAASKALENIQQLTALVPPAQLVSSDTVREALKDNAKDPGATDGSDDYDMDVLREFFVVDN